MGRLTGRRVAVVGGTGFIGSHLTERLVREGADVLAVARSAERLHTLESVRTDCVVAIGDVRDADGLTRMFGRFRPEVVFHLAAHPDGHESFAHMAECLRTNGLGLVNALQAAAGAGADVFIYGDSAKNYGNSEVPLHAAAPEQPICSYAGVKTAGWHLCQVASRFSSLKTVALRPTLVYGPRQGVNIVSYVRACALAGRPVRLMGGEQTRSPLFVDDAVGAYVAAATHPPAWGHAIPVGGSREVTVRELAHAVLSAMGASVPIEANAEAPRATEIWRSAVDLDDAERHLHWRPQIELDEGLARTLATDEAAARPSLGVRPRLRPDCYLFATDPGVAYQMLDRREGLDRRVQFRGGRRLSDVRAMAAFGGPTNPRNQGSRRAVTFAPVGDNRQ